MSKIFVQIVKNNDGTYSANMLIDGKFINGLPEHVNYNELTKSIKELHNFEIRPRKHLNFQKLGGKCFAEFDNYGTLNQK